MGIFYFKSLTSPIYIRWCGAIWQQKESICIHIILPIHLRAGLINSTSLSLTITFLSGSMSPLCCSDLIKEEAPSHTDLISNHLTLLQTSLLLSLTSVCCCCCSFFFQYPFEENLFQSLFFPLQTKFLDTVNTLCGRIPQVFLKQVEKTMKAVYEQRVVRRAKHP